MHQTDLILGTAFWNWSVSKETARQMLGMFYAGGGRWVDVAGNYPLNGNPADYRSAENIVADWLQAQNINDMKVICKFGSLTNSNVPTQNLAPSFVLLAHDYYRRLFQNNYASLMVHWDNRVDDALLDDDIGGATIAQTCEQLIAVGNDNIRVGLSGIKDPATYAAHLPAIIHPLIEIKYNPLQFQSLEYYKAFHDRTDFCAYGLTMGGLKTSLTEYNATSAATLRGANTNADIEAIKNNLARMQANSHPAAPQNLTQYGMLFAQNAGAKGLIIGPSKIEQLQDTLDYHRVLTATQPGNLWEAA